jgi:uncharacterized membrane protein
MAARRSWGGRAAKHIIYAPFFNSASRVLFVYLLLTINLWLENRYTSTTIVEHHIH